MTKLLSTMPDLGDDPIPTRPHYQQVCLRFTDEQLDALRVRAVDDGVSVAEIVRRAVAAYASSEDT